MSGEWISLVEVLERDERSLTRILHGLDEIDADRHGRDSAPTLNVVVPAAARQQRRGEVGSEPRARHRPGQGGSRARDGHRGARPERAAELERAGETTTFAVVTARARVSRQFLYSQPQPRADMGGSAASGGRQHGFRYAGAQGRIDPRQAPPGARGEQAAADQIAGLRGELALAHGRVRELELATRARSAR